MYKKHTAIGITMLLIYLIFMPGPSFAGKNSKILTGVTTGSKEIINHDIQKAKQTAVSDALKTAVQNAFVTLVSRQIMASNLDFFYDRILSRTSDYIITYRVLGGIENNGHYLVGVESKVDLALLEQTLVNARILDKSGDKPVIMFFIVEKTQSDLQSRYWWGKNPIKYQSIAEKIIINKMGQAQFIITGNKEPRPDPSFYNINFDSIYDVSAAKNLGREMKADIIIFGKADSSEAINRMGEEKAFHSVINLQGYNLETGKKVIESRVEAVATSNFEHDGNILAISKAANISAMDLIEKINNFWTQNLRQEHTFDVKIEGDNFLARFLALKRKLKKMPAIENMQHKEIATNYAIIQIFYKGKSSQFANNLMLKTFESFGLEISDVSENYINIRFIEKGQSSSLKNDSQTTPLLNNFNMETNQNQDLKTTQ